MDKTKEQIEQIFAEIDAKVNSLPKQKSFQVDASCDAVSCKEEPVVCYDDLRYIHDRINMIRDDYYRISERLANHVYDGHLPKLEGASQMKKALKAIGLDEDYEVQKKVIYASNGTPEKTLWEISTPIK